MSVSSEQATQVVNEFFEAYRGQDVDRMVDLCHYNADFYYRPFEVWARQRVIRGDGKVHSIGKTFWRTLINSFPDLSNEVKFVTADDEGNVAVEVNIGGTQARPFGTLASPGASYDLPHVFLFRVGEAGLIDEISAYWDTADWYQQLGRVEVD
jgi:steroid delta-isomerase-like uncharacterized protein